MAGSSVFDPKIKSTGEAVRPSSPQTNKGYVVCRAEDVVFGEAIFSIHPDDSNFVLTYLDYGLDALSYVGTCKKP